jgi:hypothetical protein
MLAGGFEVLLTSLHFFEKHGKCKYRGVITFIMQIYVLFLVCRHSFPGASNTSRRLAGCAKVGSGLFGCFASPYIFCFPAEAELPFSFVPDDFAE